MAPQLTSVVNDRDAVLYSAVAGRLFRSRLILEDLESSLNLQLSVMHRLRLETAHCAVSQYIERDPRVRRDILDRYGFEEIP